MSLPTSIFQYRGGYYAKWYDAGARRMIWKKLAPTKSLAQEALRALQTKLVSGPLRTYSRVTLRQYYERHYKPDYLSNGTAWQAKQLELCAAYILPRWGSSIMSELALYDVQSWYRELLAIKSRCYANHIVSVLMTMLRRARGRFIAASPLADFKKLRREKKVPDTLTHDQVNRLYTMLDGRDRALMCVWIMTGLRPAEMQWLQWVDINLDNGKLIVRSKRQMPQGNAAMRAGHSIKDAEDRYIDLTSDAIDLLREHRGPRMPAADEFVFPNNRGQLMMSMPNHVYKVFKRSGIRNGSANLLRHTFASMFLSGGGNLAELKQYMGHSSIVITEQHYAAFLSGKASTIHRVDFGMTAKAEQRHVLGKVAQVT
jgi:integrase